MKKSLVALAYLLRQPKYRGRKNHNLPIKFDRKENPFRGVFLLTRVSCSYIHGTTERKIMTEEEFLALVNLFEFVQQSKKSGDKLDKDLATVRELIKRQGDLYGK